MVELLREHNGFWNRRFEVGLDDGARVESVLYRGDNLCISCQVGCAVRCPFCASGSNGLMRNLSADEMTAQVTRVQALGASVRRVTISGVGEPLHNAQSVANVIAWCRNQSIRVSLTTSGGPVTKLRSFMHMSHNGLTISVHAGTAPVRARMVPKGPSLQDLFGALEDELPRVTQRRKRKLALAYLLIGGENDSNEEVDAFLARATPLGLKLHLYAYNPVPTSTHRGVDGPRYQAIYDRMAATGLRVRMSSQARVESNGGCGTLVALKRSTSPGT